MSSYYERQIRLDPMDGTPTVQTEDDLAAERRIKTLLEERWDCECRPFGNYCPLDWFAIRNERMIGVVEMKHRSHPHDAYPTVFLNVRKWVALRLASVGLGVPDIYVVEFSDGEVRWVRVGLVDASRVEVSGCLRKVKAYNDIEPVIHVPLDQMQPL